MKAKSPQIIARSTRAMIFIAQNVPKTEKLLNLNNLICIIQKKTVILRAKSQK